MAYSLHIERDGGPIPLEEWKRTVLCTEGARLLDIERKTVNPATGAIIQMNGSDGDVEIMLHSFSECISFCRGRGTFRARQEYENQTHPIRQVIARLADTLGAKIVGDEGEVYEW